MSTTLDITPMSKADAVTVNDKVQTTIADAIEEVGEEAVGPPVVDAARALDEASTPLRGSEPLSYEERQEVNTAEDRCVSHIHDTCEGTIATFDQSVTPLSSDEQASLDAAHLLMDTLFPVGKRFIIGRWSEQYGRIEIMLTHADEQPVVDALSKLGLSASVSILRRLNGIFGERLGFTVKLPSSDNDPLTLWHGALESYLAAVIYSHRGNDAMKERLTEPYETMAAALRAARRRRSKPAEDAA